MTPGRNDPCHCGSGRKYNHCCQARDLEEARQADDRVVPFRGRLARAVRDAAAAERIWQADVIPLMITIRDDPASRPVVVMVTAGDIIVSQDFPGRMPGGAAAVAAAIERTVSGAARQAGAFPERLRVRHDDVAQALEPLLGARAVAVEAGDTPELVAAARAMMRSVAGHEIWPPPCHVDEWDAWDLPRALVTQVFAAAAAFYRRAPWRHASNLQAPSAVLPSGRMWTCGILGDGGEEFGLALYSDAWDLFDVVAMNATGELFEGIHGRIISLTFEAAESVGAAAFRTARTRRLEVAGPAAYPVLGTINTPGGGVSREEIGDLIALLRALPAFTDAHAAALEREVRTGDPLGPLAWTEPASGIVFHYSGEAADDIRREMNELPAFDGDDVADDMPLHLDTLPFDMRNELRDAVAEVIEELGEDADEDALMAALNSAMEQRTRGYNTRFQADLGGLSPTQVQRLLSSDWNDPNGAVQLEQGLSLDAIAHVAFLRRARALLDFAIEHGPMGATQAGNLKLTVVSDLIDHLELADPFAPMRARGKRITEQDVWPLHIVRVICDVAGLLHRRSQHFHITRKGRRLADPAHAGELYALLFRTWFRDFNIEYVSPMEWPGLQQQVAFTLYHLPAAAAEWRTADALLRDVVLPFVLDNAPRGSPEWPLAPLAFARAVLHPLADLGLLEVRSAEPPGRGQTLYRSAPLAAKLIRFALN